MASIDVSEKDKDQIMRQMLGKRIREARKRSGLTQEELSLNSGVDQAHISNVERGDREPGIGVLIRLANAMNVTIDSIVVDQYAHAEQVYPVYVEKLASLFEDCDAQEAAALYETLVILKKTIRIEAERAAEKEKKSQLFE